MNSIADFRRKHHPFHNLVGAFRRKADYKDEETLPEFKGKEAVFYSLKRVSENEKLSAEIDRCVFIVDRDFSDNISSSRVKLKASDYKRVLVTYGHSMESYFLEQDNVAILLDRFGADPVRFWELFSDFAGAISQYYALNAVITENYKTVRYRKKFSSADILTFDFSRGDDFWDGYNAMLEECRLMKDKLGQNRMYLQRAAYLETKIRSNPRYIRGHDAFTFLEEYLHQLYKVEISFGYDTFARIKPIIGKFAVQLLRK